MRTFISRGIYGNRKATHMAAYQLTPGWLFLEVGSLTLELETPAWAQGIVDKLAGPALNPA